MITAAVAQQKSTLRGHRLYPAADRVLAVYYALRMDWIAQSAQCDCSPATQDRSSHLSSAVAFMCDVGRVLEDVLTNYERDEVLPRRWNAFFNWQLAVGEHQRVKRGLSRGRSNCKLARKAETVARWERDAWELECDRLSRRKAYRQAVSKVDAELKARDLYARAAIGKRVSIPVPPEWTV